MKRTLLLVLSMSFLSFAMAQLKAKSQCSTFMVDILDGKVNGMKPNFSADEIKTKLPCFTSVAEEGAKSKCGTGVFYKDRDIYFYTQREYIEIGEKFKGQLSIPLIGARRNSLFKVLGNPRMKDDTWDAFQMSYGTLVLHYNTGGKVNLIQFSTKSTESLSLCE